MKGFEDMSVSDLMNENMSSWNSDLIKRMFREEEANLIMSIPLSLRHREDKCIYAYSQYINF